MGGTLSRTKHAAKAQPAFLRTYIPVGFREILVSAYRPQPGKHLLHVRENESAPLYDGANLTPHPDTPGREGTQDTEHQKRYTRGKVEKTPPQRITAKRSTLLKGLQKCLLRHSPIYPSSVNTPIFLTRNALPSLGNKGSRALSPTCPRVYPRSIKRSFQPSQGSWGIRLPGAPGAHSQACAPSGRGSQASSPLHPRTHAPDLPKRDEAP